MEARILTDLDGKKYREVRRKAADESEWNASDELRQEGELFDHDPNRVMTIHRGQGTRVWGAFDDMLLAGVMAMSYLQLLNHPRNLWLWGLYVRPKYRGTPASRMLMESVLRWREEHAPGHRLLGACDPGNLNVARFLDRYGFQPPADHQSLMSASMLPRRLLLVEFTDELS